MNTAMQCNLIDCDDCIWHDLTEPVGCLKIRDQWLEFGDIPMDPETECIECEWNGFPAGTHREEIWSWFEETHNVRVADLMYV